MKFISEKETLANAIKAAASAVTGAILPAEENVKLTLAGSDLLVIGNDPSLTIEVKLKVKGEDDGKLCMPARTLNEVVGSLAKNSSENNGVITISDKAEDQADSVSSDIEGSIVSVYDQVTKYSVPQLSAGDFTSISIDSKAAKTKLKAEELVKALRQVVKMASTNPSRPVLNGVLMEPRESGVRLVATDTFRLGVRDIKNAAFPKDSTKGVLVPSSSLNHLISIAGEAKEVEISFTETQASFEFESFKIITQLLPGDFPEYEKLLPTDYPDTLEVNKEELANALDRVGIMARDDSNNLIRTEIQKDQTELVAIDRNKGKSAETITSSFTGENLELGFNATFLKEALSSFEDKEMIVDINGALKPLLLRGKTKKEFQCLLMPVRLNSGN